MCDIHFCTWKKNIEILDEYYIQEIRNLHTSITASYKKVIRRYYTYPFTVDILLLCTL
jgi:hypothetical protein